MTVGDLGLAVVCLGTAYAQGVMTTLAGTDWVFPGDGKPALNAPLGAIRGMAVDPNGNPVVVVNNDCYVARIETTGILSVIAGNGFCGLTFLLSGDGGPATSAGIYSPFSAAYDSRGNLYVSSLFQVRRIAPDGTISLFAGSPTVRWGFSGDGGPADKALINSGGGLAADRLGNVYIGDSQNNRVRKVAPDGTISTVAGNGTQGFAGDGGPAVQAQLSFPLSVATDAAGNLYIADVGNLRVRKVTPEGIISTVASGLQMSSIAVDNAGNIYVGGGHAVSRISAGGGPVVVVAGGSTAGFAGDNGPATSAQLQGALYVAADAAGNVYVGDSGNARVRKFTVGGNIQTIAGNGRYRYTGEGAAANTAFLRLPYGVAVDAAGAVYFSEREGHRIRKVTKGVITTVAGTGTPGFSGDGGLAIHAQMNSPQGVAFDDAGNLYVADSGRVRRITPAGIISTFAVMPNPIALAFDAAGNLYVARSSCCVVKVSPGGAITPFAGTGTRGNSGDGGPAVNALLNNPAGIAVDRDGNVFISDPNENRVRKVTPNGIISTFLSGGLGFPSALRIDSAGNLLIASHLGARIRRATPAGVVSVIAGGGPDDQLGDGKIATQASHPVPNEMAFDAAGNLYIADEYNYRVRVVLAAPPSIQATPAAVSLSGASGGAPVSQTVTVTGSLVGLDFRATVDTGGAGNWLAVDAASGSTPRVLTVTVDPTNLAPGTHVGTVVITPAAGTPSRLALPVTFVAGPAQAPRLTTDRANLSFSFPLGVAASQASLVVSNSGGGAIDFTAAVNTTTGGNWLGVSPASGQATPGRPVALTVTANSTGLGAGTYTGSIRVDGGAGGSVTLPVILSITNLSKVLRLTQSGLGFTAVAQGGVVPAQTFGVLNTGTGELAWNASTSTLAGGQGWLRASPSNGVSDPTKAAPQVTVSVQAAGLAPGTYYGLVRIEAPGAANTPQVVPISLEVLPAGSDPAALVHPRELVFAAVAGGVPPGSQILEIYNTSATPKGFVTGRPPQGFAILAAPREGLVDPQEPSRVVIQPAGSFAAGTTAGALTFQFSDGRLQTVKITVISTPAASADGRTAGGCTPTRLVPALTTLGESFTVSAGWPVGLVVRVADDCGNPHRRGSVNVSFSNGDPPLPLASLNDGIWHTTWVTSRGGTKTVRLKVEASDPEMGISGSREVAGALGSEQDPPLFALNSIGSAARPVPFQPLAPGSFISIFGSRLADFDEAAKSAPLPKKLGNTTVVIQGREAPLHFVTPGQINALVPYEVRPDVPQQIVIMRGDTLSRAVVADVAPAQPAVFLAAGGAIAVAYREGAEPFLVSPSARARAGDILVIYCAGLGLTNPPVGTGTASPLSPVAQTAGPVKVTIGGVDAAVGFAGLTPGSTGLYQVNAVVPAGVSPSDAVALTLSVAGQTSVAASLAIQ